MRAWKRAGVAGVLMVLTGGDALAGTSSAPPLPPPRPAVSRAEEPASPDVPLPPPRPPGLDAATVTAPTAQPIFPLPWLAGFPRPVSASSPPPAPAVEATPPARDAAGPPSAPDDELVCAALFGSGKVVARAATPVAPTAQGCAMPAPVEVSAVVVAPGRSVRFEPPITTDCALAGAVADWVREDLVPTFASTGSALHAITDSGGYECRGRNRVAGAKLSEHAHGNAVDVGGWRTADGRTISVQQGPASTLARIRDTACGRFATVLGPGSDGFHERHLHVDLATRRHGSKICHWVLS